MKVGIITYNYHHLKTEQVMQYCISRFNDICIYSLPFHPRKSREVLFAHRPDQSIGVHPQVLAMKHGIPYASCDTDLDIDDGCDVYLVLVGKIISPECIKGKNIINCHPGIIPSSRGLDSFKWAILEGKPLGNTLHYIDAQVDAGEIISILPTTVYKTDTLASLARRHYENEIQMTCDFHYHLNHPSNPFHDIPTGDARMRMSRKNERVMIDGFASYLAKYS